LEDSIKAPKYFTSTLPPPTYDTEKIYVHRFITDLKPKDCVGVVEVEVELLTGRTHQIRGQLSLMGFPLCGDAMYGGSIPKSTVASLASYNAFGKDVGYLNSELLALQCCELSFPDPDYVVSGKKGKITGIQSDRFNRFRLERAWWTPYLETYLNEKLSS
jgi:23S rRNA-/tRNA-specific pseudouridylate synthase